MRAVDIMTRDVIAVETDATVAEVARLLVTHAISGMPVVNAKRQVVGIVSEGDLLRRVEIGTEGRRSWWLELLADDASLAANYVKTHGRKVHEVMTSEVITVTEETTVDRIVDLMERHRIKRVPVLRDGALVGIVSRANVLRAVASRTAGVEPLSADDRAIHDVLLERLKEQPWIALGTKNIIVSDRVAHIWGVVRSAAERQGLIVAAENVPGVKGVEDHTRLEPVGIGLA